MILIGGGNSIRDFSSLWDDLCGYEIMAINYAYKFLKKPPKWIFSIDRKFWRANTEELRRQKAAGSQLIGHDLETSKTWCEDKVFCGARKLSGLAALSWAMHELKPERTFLFGFDFGLIDGRTHFYDEPKHSGIGKTSAYHDGNGKVHDAVKDFEHFKNREIYVIGRSNIKCLPRVEYATFVEKKGILGLNSGIVEGSCI